MIRPSKKKHSFPKWKQFGTQPSVEAVRALVNFVNLPPYTIFHGSEKSLIKTSTEVKVTPGYSTSPLFF